MARNSAAQTHVAPRAGDCLHAVGELLRRAGLDELRLIPDADDAPGESTPLVQGWRLAGVPDAGRRAAAGELMLRLFEAEHENESLCAEIIDRYEEATLVYRLCRRLATVCDPSSTAQVVIEDVVRALDTRTGELWVCRPEGVMLSACHPLGEQSSPDLREQGPLSALHENRPWVREASVGGEAVVAVPLPGPQAGPVGVLVLRGRAKGESFRTGHVKLLAAVASLTAAFLRNRAAREGSER